MTDVIAHQIQRVRRETRRRLVTVASAERLTPRMQRITFESPELADFASDAPDDHIKLIVPDAAAPEGKAMRDYTPRAFDRAAGRLVVDFALHDAGPATLWAMQAKPGDQVQIGGPRGSAVVPDDFDHYLLIGDGTALPAIGRRLEELRAGVPVTTVVVLDGPEDKQAIETATAWTPLWVFRDGRGDDAALVRAALADWRAPAGDGFVFIGAEARVARQLRDFVTNDLGMRKEWIRAAGYWIAGEAGATERIES